MAYLPVRRALFNSPYAINSAGLPPLNTRSAKIEDVLTDCYFDRKVEHKLTSDETTTAVLHVDT